MARTASSTSRRLRARVPRKSQNCIPYAATISAQSRLVRAGAQIQIKIEIQIQIEISNRGECPARGRADVRAAAV
eukprot:SAG31_NODE_45544_length_258_cov_0.962264_1_plen_74_part_10